MPNMRTIQFPGSNTVYEVTDAQARSNVAALQSAMDDLVDDTLSVSGKAADAAAVGDRLEQAEAALETGMTQAAAQAVAGMMKNYGWPYETVGIKGSDQSAALGVSSFRTDGSVPAPFRALALYGKSIQSGTPAPDSPAAIVTAGEAGTLELVSCGRNLANITARNSSASNGVTFTYEDGAIVADGTASGANGVSLAGAFQRVLPAGTYTVYDALGGAHAQDRYIVIQAYDGSAYTTLAQTRGGPASFALSEPTNVTVRMSIANGASVTSLRCRPTITADGTSEGDYPYAGVTVAVPTPNGLAGVPVASGGNYTDFGGRQWICDELDFARGVYVRRCGTIAGYGGEALPGAWLSSMDVYAAGSAPTAGAAVVYALAEPVTTDLTAAQLEALGALVPPNGDGNIYTTDAAQPTMFAQYYQSLEYRLRQLLT